MRAACFTSTRQKRINNTAEVCPGSGQQAIDEATIIAAAAKRRREALRQMTRSR
jgi:hypothetical protein